MTRKPSKRSGRTPAQKKAAPSGSRSKSGSGTTIEWVGGISAMPAYVTGEGDPYRPEMLIWMDADGMVVGHRLARPGGILAEASESLRSAIEEPIIGPPRAPTRLRVASAELAQAIRAGHPGIEVVCAPTPELDELLTQMKEKIHEDAEGERSYLRPGSGPEAVAAFFRAAAGLFRAAPWQVVPDDQSLFSVTIEQLDVHDAAMSVIGQMGQSRGFLLFSGLDGFEAYLEAADEVEHGGDPTIPPHFALSFERGSGLAPELRKQIARHRWEIAAANAYPWLVAIDEDLVGRPPTAREIAMAEAIALALSDVLAEREALLAAWSGGEPLSRTLSVGTHQGPIEVVLRAPYARAPVVFDPSRDVLAELAALARQGDEIDPEDREPLEDELVRRFSASPEAKDLDDVQACRYVLDSASTYLGGTVATIGPAELREIVFDIIPRKVLIDASEARWIVEVNRAFYRFLGRELGLEQADACLSVLGGDAVEKLEKALSDSSNFGMAKSLLMAGREAGFDMDSQAGIEAWMRSVQGRPLPPSVRLPSSAAQPRTNMKAEKAKNKKKRKAARKARKRSR